ncbi:hypothetical protein D3C75_932760 [compost metagenome]
MRQYNRRQFISTWSDVRVFLIAFYLRFKLNPVASLIRKYCVVELHQIFSFGCETKRTFIVGSILYEPQQDLTERFFINFIGCFRSVIVNISVLYSVVFPFNSEGKKLFRFVTNHPVKKLDDPGRIFRILVN